LEYTIVVELVRPSVVVNTIILTAGVVAMSIAVLYWTYGMGKIGRIEYTENTNTTMSAVNERIGFEYIRYSGNTLTVNIINCGKTDNITIARVYIMNTNYQNIAVSGLNVRLYSIDSPGTQIEGNKIWHWKRWSFNINCSAPTD
jgi:hypothetical protein